MNTDQTPHPDTDICNIHLKMLGEARVFPVTVRLGKRVPLDLLPAARELTMQVTAVVVDQARAKGREISCKAGCNACCRHFMTISVVEVLSLVDLVAALTPKQQRTIHQRFSDAVRRLESARLLDPNRLKGLCNMTLDIEGEITRQDAAYEIGKRYFELGIPCPFLEHELCSIYPDRPLVCREYHVTSPSENCANVYREKVDSVQPTVHMSRVLSRAANRIAATIPITIPLVLSFEWAEVNGEQLRQTYDGLDMFKTLIKEIDQEYERPFNMRGRMGGRIGSNLYS
jgi:Fe-S-cluster containining protein